MKAYEVAELLRKIGWDAPLDAQYSELTRIVEDGSLQAAIVQDIRALAVAEYIADKDPRHD